MAAPEYLTWTGDVANGVNPYRPAVGDLGGNNKIDDADYPPQPGDPEASEWNQGMGQIAVCASAIPAAILDIRFSAGVPSLFGIIHSANPELVAGDVTVTDSGTGLVTIVIPAAKLPDARWGEAKPQVTGNHTGVAFRNAAQSLRCEIRTAGTLADVNFVAFWG
jgi:hypothetical protein